MKNPLQLKKILGRTEDISDEPEKVAQTDYLGILKNEFFTRPFLGLLEEYLIACNGSGKSTKNQVRSFKAYHPYVWRAVFVGDLLMRIVYLAVIFLIVVRGLGLEDFIVEIIKKISSR